MRQTCYTLMLITIWLKQYPVCIPLDVNGTARTTNAEVTGQVDVGNIIPQVTQLTHPN